VVACSGGDGLFAAGMSAAQLAALSLQRRRVAAAAFGSLKAAALAGQRQPAS